jgi:predicted dehydrogenase
VIGVGAIGQDHIRRLTHVVSGSRIVALTDVDAQRAQSAAGSLDGARVHATGQDLIDDGDVEAILVASWGPTHEEYVLASIAAGKPVFCEKPLAPTPDACLRIVEAEVARGRRLVQVGYMRRYDAGYRAMKNALAREVFVNCGYGYDIRCEVVAESGTVALSGGGEIVTTSNGLRSRPVPADWRERFVRAYDVELQEWVEAVSTGEATGPSSWDGYAAAAVVESCLEALKSGQRSTVQLEDRPELYRIPGGTNTVEQSTESHMGSR